MHLNDEKKMIDKVWKQVLKVTLFSQQLSYGKYHLTDYAHPLTWSLEMVKHTASKNKAEPKQDRNIFTLQTLPARAYQNTYFDIFFTTNATTTIAVSAMTCSI